MLLNIYDELSLIKVLIYCMVIYSKILFISPYDNCIDAVIRTFDQILRYMDILLYGTLLTKFR